MVVMLLFNDGDQVPMIPLLEVVGNGAKVFPAHIVGTCVKIVVTIGLTVMVIELLLIMAPLAQEALLVSSQEITSPLLLVLLLYVAAVETMFPFRFQT